MRVCALAAVMLAPGAPAFAQPDPVAQANQAVAEAQAQADRVASAYFAALDRARQLDAQIVDLQRGTDALRHHVARLKRVAGERAVEAYKRVGSSLDVAFFDTDRPIDSARRAVMLDLLNARDNEAIDALQQSRNDLARRRHELDTARHDESDTLARLKDEEQRLNDKLVAAQHQRQLALDQQLQAQQAAAAAQQQAAAPQQPAASPAPAPPTPAPAATPRPAPTPVPGNYTPTAGVNPHHDDPYLTCVRHYESSGNYQAYNPGGPAFGAYQFLQSTWNGAANHAGRGDLVGLDPRRASQWDQDEMAWNLYQWQGKRPWSVDPC